MSLQERVYSVLVVSAAETFNSALPDLLSPGQFDPVVMVSSISAAKRAWSQRAYDCVIINAPLLDDPGTRFAIDVCSTQGTVALLLVRANIYEELLPKATANGVFLLARPISKQTFRNALTWLSSARERLRRMEKKTMSIEEKMREIRKVNRAKWLLIQHESMTEEQAHHFIERKAMDQCITKGDVAQNILSEYGEG